ncbi:MAG: hypothetical protein ACRC5H_06675 [Treponemataceae bacterium]
MSFFLSCSSNVPSIRSTRQKLIFSYEGETHVPVLSLSAFVLVGGSYDRIMYIDLEHEETKLRWTISDLTFMGNTKETWFGSASIRSPWQLPFPSGKYLITVTDTAQDTTRSFFDMAYPEKFLSLSLVEAKETAEFQSLTAEYLVIYSDENEILYFDQEESELSTTEGILGAYPIAASYRIFKTSSTVSYGVMMPATHISKDIQ